MSSDPVRKNPGRENPVRKLSARAERTQADILAAAAECFSKSGFQGSSVDDIAAAAGVTKPTIYAHFENKETLFDRLLQSHFAQVKDHIIERPTKDTDAGAVLLSLGRMHAEQLLTDDSLGLYRAVAAEMMRRPEWTREMFGAMPEDGLVKWLRQAKKVGLLNMKRPEDSACFFWASVKGTLFYPVLLGLRPPPTKKEREQLLSEAVRIFLAAHSAA